MDCNSCNQNEQYYRRNSVNMAGGMNNSWRNNSGNMSQNRNNNGNMNQARNMYGNMNQPRNAYGNMNQNRNNSYNMNRSENNRQNNWYGNNNRSEQKNSDNECGCKDDMYKGEKNEGCDRGNKPIDKMMPGMGYVPWQKWEDVYDMEKGLERGTIFARLDKPYVGRSAK